MLMKLPTGVNFTNILQTAPTYEFFSEGFYDLEFGFVISWQKNIGEKATSKILVKLSIGPLLREDGHRRESSCSQTNT